MAVAIALERGHTSTLYNPGLDDFLGIPDINYKDLIKLRGLFSYLCVNTEYKSVILRNH